MADSIVSKTLDELFSSFTTGSLDRAIINNLRGFNHRQTPGMVPSNRDMPGLVFFTRPQLNMQRDNIRNVRQLSQLMTTTGPSMQNYIRCMLDPRLMTGVHFAKAGTIKPIDCPIVDNLQAFIPVLTNSCTSMSPWPSISVPTFTSTPGLYNEAFSMVDGRVLNDESWDLNVNFRNTRGDPILYLFYVWALYMSMVFEGKLVPYLDMITENEIDYNTRVYRLTLDYQKRKVTKIAACHAAFPIGVPVGDAFGIPGDQTYSDANKDIGMTFRCIGASYFDTILVKEFNEVVGIFNPDMTDARRNQNMLPVPHSLLPMFNNRGYPYIDPMTMELQWFISINDYYENAGQALANIPQGDVEEEIGE